MHFNMNDLNTNKFIFDDDDDKFINIALEVMSTLKSENKNENIHEFDKNAGEIWIYPNNYPIRDYQYNIVQKALFNNTLVALPTGLGKTFIAAVLMFNFYRWYPRGKIVFMAPSRPLVNQQIEACYKIMSTPKNDTVEMTGKTNPDKRKLLWNSKRVIFLTPQVMMNDLCKGFCPAQQIKCLVVDEAHKALGNYAYCQVINQLLPENQDFRVLALTATPGKDLKAVEQVLSNLQIAHIEFRTEESLDVRPYTFGKTVQKIVIPLTQELQDFRQKISNILEECSRRLVDNNLLFKTGRVENLNKFSLIQARERFRAIARQPSNRTSTCTFSKGLIGVMEHDFALCITLLHALELLTFYGLRSFCAFVQNSVANPNGELLENGSAESSVAQTSPSSLRPLKGIINNASKSALNKIPEFRDVINEIREKMNYNLSSPSSTSGQKLILSHPKLTKLVEIVKDHFNNHREKSDAEKLPVDSGEPGDEKKGDSKSHVIIFSQYRESVLEISEILAALHPLIRVGTFIGQMGGVGSQAKSKWTHVLDAKNYTQKDQLQVSATLRSMGVDSIRNRGGKVIKNFRDGTYNTLVATCVGEEGLDVGHVDLIICYDVHRSPIRHLQRIGRTGRAREGRVIVLLSEGREEKVYSQGLSNKRSVFKALEELIAREASCTRLNAATSRKVCPVPESQSLVTTAPRFNPRMVPGDCQPKPCSMYINCSADDNKEISKLGENENSASKKVKEKRQKRRRENNNLAMEKEFNGVDCKQKSIIDWAITNNDIKGNSKTSSGEKSRRKRVKVGNGVAENEDTPSVKTLSPLMETQKDDVVIQETIIDSEFTVNGLNLSQTSNHGSDNFEPTQPIEHYQELFDFDVECSGQTNKASEMSDEKENLEDFQVNAFLNSIQKSELCLKTENTSAETNSKDVAAVNFDLFQGDSQISDGEFIDLKGVKSPSFTNNSGLVGTNDQNGEKSPVFTASLASFYQEFATQCPKNNDCSDLDRSKSSPVVSKEFVGPNSPGGSVDLFADQETFTDIGPVNSPVTKDAQVLGGEKEEVIHNYYSRFDLFESSLSGEEILKDHNKAESPENSEVQLKSSSTPTECRPTGTPLSTFKALDDVWKSEFKLELFDSSFESDFNERNDKVKCALDPLNIPEKVPTNSKNAGDKTPSKTPGAVQQAKKSTFVPTQHSTPLSDGKVSILQARHKFLQAPQSPLLLKQNPSPVLGGGEHISKQPNFCLNSTSSDTDTSQLNIKGPRRPKTRKRRLAMTSSSLISDNDVIDARDFLDFEAEESQKSSGNSGDHSELEKDGDSTDLSGFVVDRDSNKHDETHDQSAMQAYYLESVKDLAPAAGKFKITGPSNNFKRCDIYSQYPTTQELNESYAYDSFCVGPNEGSSQERTTTPSDLQALKKPKRRLKIKGKNYKILQKNSDASSQNDRSPKDNQDQKRRSILIKSSQSDCSQNRDNTTYYKNPANLEFQGIQMQNNISPSIFNLELSDSSTDFEIT